MLLIQEIKLMEENINLSLFKDFFELSSPADYAKILINTKNSDQNKEIVAEIKNRISDFKYRIKNMSETEKKSKSVNETLEIIENFPNYNKNVQITFLVASKVNNGKSEPK